MYKGNKNLCIKETISKILPGLSMGIFLNIVTMGRNQNGTIVWTIQKFKICMPKTV